MTDAQKRAEKLKNDITKDCIKHGLNLTIVNGGIGFVDQFNKKIVAIWKPEYIVNKLDD